MSGVFFYVQNLLGIGHLRRAAVLAKAMSEAGLKVDFVAGGMPVAGLDFGGARLVQLPPVRSADERFSALLDREGRPIDEAWRQRRRAALLEAFAASDPDALMIELYPFGRRAFRFELQPLLEAASARPGRPAILCSVRDILVEKAKPGRAEEAAELVERHFDAVLVHGDPSVAAFSASFPAAERIAERLRYTGYVVEESRAEAAASGPAPEGEVLVSAGGGAVGRPLVEAALAARPLSAARGLPWRLVLGPQYPEPEASRLLAEAGPGLAVERFRPELAQLFGRCALSISQAGYNTVLELVSAGARAIVVPFSAGAESEQAARARLLERRGLLTVVEEAMLAPDTLAAAIDRALTRPRPNPGGGLRLNGARETAAFLLEAVARRRASRHDGGRPDRVRHRRTETLVTAAMRYRRSDLLLDYGRAALGAGLSGAVLTVPTAPAVSVVAGGLTALFGVFAVRTAARQITRYELSLDGIAEIGWRTVTLHWSELDALKLRYYAPRRKKVTGWMALSLRGGGRRLSLDSTLPEFEQVAALAVAAARRNGLELDDITVGNLAALDLTAPPAAERT